MYLSLIHIWYDWFIRFKAGRTSIEENPRPCLSSTSISNDKIDEVRTMLCTLTVCEIAEELGISVGICHEMLIGKLNMHRISATFVLRLLSDDNKENRVNIKQELLYRASACIKF